MSFRLLPMAIRAVLQTADTHNAKIPKALRADLENSLELIANVATTSFAGQSIADAVNDAVRNGEDPTESADVQAAFIRDRVQELQSNGALDNAARTNLHQVTVDAVDGLFDAFKPIYDAAGAQLAAAHATFVANGIPTMDDTQIANANLDVAQANVDARKAQATLRSILNALDALEAALGKMGSGNGVGRAVATFDLGTTPASDLRRFLGAMTPWEALTEGYTISLANPTEQRARIARANRADEDTNASFAQQQHDAMATSWGKIPVESRPKV